MAQSVADILGCPLDYATSLLEASGGDTSLAIELGLGSGAGGSAPMETEEMTATPSSPAPAAASAAASFTPPYAHWNAIWPAMEPLPDAWKNQRLDAFVDSSNVNDLRLVQPRNGPCGVLAVIQAELWLESPFANDTRESHVKGAISNILWRVMRQSKFTKIHFPRSGDIGGSSTAMEILDAAKSIKTAADLVEAVATTAGITSASAGSTLVEGPNWLCSADLLCLLLRGRRATDDASWGAFHPVTRQKRSFYTPPQDNSSNHFGDRPIGLLSYSLEVEQGIPVADDLKLLDSSEDKKVWILHTGDHFVTMRRLNEDNNNNNNTSIQLEVYDGLKPTGPVAKHFQVSGDVSLALKAPDVLEETFSKKRVGQPDDIVQAKKTSSLNYKDWTFEVVPAADDPDVQGPIDNDPKEPVWDFATLPPLSPTEPWRCASCYATRFQTMQFGQNEAGTTACSACQKPQAQAMWSRWLPYAELSPRMKRRARGMYASKLEMVIATLYPNAEIAETSSTML